MDIFHSQNRSDRFGVAFDPSADQRGYGPPVAPSLRERAGSGPVFGSQNSRPQPINFSPGSYGTSSPSFSGSSNSYRDVASSITDAAAPFTPMKSLNGIGKTAGDIFSGFYQSENGNCATVSAIKVAMERFGKSAKDVFKNVQETASGTKVTLRDGKTVEITKDELDKATQHAALKGNDPQMIKEASLMYAVTAKQAENENHEGSKGNFSKALDSLKNGEYTKDAFERLGLENYVKQGSISDLQKGALGIIEKDVGGPGTGHSMAVIGGVEERWGKRGGPVAGGKIADGKGREWPHNVLILA